jgi:hypothetical protein
VALHLQTHSFLSQSQIKVTYQLFNIKPIIELPS